MRRVRHVALIGLLLASSLSAQSGFGFQQIPGNLSQISVGFDGAVWGVNAAGQIYTWDAQSSSWTEIPGSLKQIAVGSSTAVWGINSEGQVYRWKGSQWFATWDLIPLPEFFTGHFTQIAVGTDGDAWAIDSVGHAYHYYIQIPAWEPVVDANVNSIRSAGPAGGGTARAQGEPSTTRVFPVQRAAACCHRAGLEYSVGL